MERSAPYDAISDWYEHDFLARQGGSDPLRISAALRELLGPGSGICLELGCGTGVHARQVRQLGWTPVVWTCQPACCDTRPPGYRSPEPTPGGYRYATARCQRSYQ